MGTTWGKRQEYERDGIKFASDGPAPYSDTVQVTANGHVVLNGHFEGRGFKLGAFVDKNWKGIQNNMEHNAKTAAAPKPKYSGRVQRRIDAGQMGVRTLPMESGPGWKAIKP